MDTKMRQYSQYENQPVAQNPMLISSQIYNPTDVCTKDRIRYAPCMNTLISHLNYQVKHQAHLAIAKALLAPIAAMICILLGQILQRTASASKEEYQASLLKSLLAGFVGGQCLVGSVIVLNVVFDTGPTPGKLWHRHVTFTSMFIIFLAAGAAGPLGAKIINAEGDPSTSILDPRHALYSSSLGAGLIFWILLIVKALLLTHRKLDALDTYNSTNTMCDWCSHSCTDYDCNCCRGCTDCSCCNNQCCDCCDCCKGCGGCGGCGGCDCNCNCNC
ncbi:hypothetical protein BDZ94DRAFT_169829 [Collybia nuda]|uniref:Uncharacterized protein n=1 Tax=Collybia nuda TaxID=64659 RepID=A0A9P5YC01_9AGAR|nr:hypothetical protein BDZ94DRAFT_169829 [Collybia nuda]